jgi:hypothetical protein
MSFHIKRSQTSKLDVLQQYSGTRSTRWVHPPPEGKSVLEIQTHAYRAAESARGQELLDAALSLYADGPPLLHDVRLENVVSLRC